MQGCLNQTDALQVEIERWKADIDKHRSEFLLSDRERGSADVSMKEIDAAQKSVEDIILSLAGTQGVRFIFFLACAS